MKDEKGKDEQTNRTDDRFTVTKEDGIDVMMGGVKRKTRKYCCWMLVLSALEMTPVYWTQDAANARITTMMLALFAAVYLVYTFYHIQEDLRYVLKKTDWKHVMPVHCGYEPGLRAGKVLILAVGIASAVLQPCMLLAAIGIDYSSPTICNDAITRISGLLVGSSLTCVFLAAATPYIWWDLSLIHI